LLAAAHITLDEQARTPARRMEVILIYLFAISVGASGLGGAFGHLFLSDTVAAAIGWPTGSPFQLEMGYANLALGVLGFMAVGRRDGLRTATIVAVTVIGAGATLVHLQDMAVHGNLAPGNTLQNISNMLDPVLLIALSLWRGRQADRDEVSASFRRWQARQQPIAGLAAAGIGMGFGLGYAVGLPLLWTLLGAAGGIGAGCLVSRHHGHGGQPFSPQHDAVIPLMQRSQSDSEPAEGSG
jgi:hypothetical protein